MNRQKHRYLQAWGVTVLVLALVRCTFLVIANKVGTKESVDAADTTVVETNREALPPVLSRKVKRPYNLETAVTDMGRSFPDSNAVQMGAAQKWGVAPVEDRNDAERRKNELVYMAASPYYDVDRLDASIPYLVPRAALLLDDIGRAFLDSLDAKQVGLHRLIVSSVLRTRRDVKKLRGANGNAVEQSCHLYGTTFDITYKRYHQMAFQTDRNCSETTADTLRWILAEVLRDLRKEGRCYVKCERRQACFHITVR